MPNAIDLFPQNHKVTHDPTVRLPVNTNNYIQPYPFDPAAQQAEYNAAILSFVAGLKALTGIDLTSFADFFLGINSQAGTQQFANGLTGVGPLIDNLWSGLNGIAISLGLEQSPEQVGSAARAQTQAVQAIAAAVARLSAQIASATLAHDAFDRTATSMGSSWGVQIYSTPFIGGGLPYCDGAQLVWAPAGVTDTTGVYRWIGTNRLATTDVTENAIVLGTPLSSVNFGSAYDDIYARMSDDGLTWVRCRIGNEGANSVVRMQFSVNGSLNEMGTLAIPRSAAGTTAKLYCGTQVDLRQFQVVIDNTTYTINDPHGASTVGASFRGRGCGHFATGFLIGGQNQPGSIADWQANDIAAPPGVATAIDGMGAADGDPTRNTLGSLVFSGS
jgi:hypothetical protein